MTSDTFAAIPLGNGESFLLETHDKDGNPKVILVDSGALKKRNKFKKHLTDEIYGINDRIQTINIAVCTHSDKDHISGYTYFFDHWHQSNKKVEEFWVPAIWSIFLRNGINDPHKLVLKLYIGALTVMSKFYAMKGDGQDITAAQVLENLKKIAIEKDVNKLFKKEGFNDTKTFDFSSIRTFLDDAGHPPSKIIKSFSRNSFYSETPRRILRNDIDDRYLLFFEILTHSMMTKTLKHSAIILKVIEGAIKHNVDLRWFDFDLFERHKKASGGVDNLLVPVSAVEVGPNLDDIEAERLFLALYLDAINAGALVFYRPEIKNCPSVLFCSDSRLSFGTNTPTGNFLENQKKPKKPPIITAPHHGSSTNDYAYCLIKSWLGSELTPIFIRNGYHPKIKIKKFFDQTNRSCAICRIPGRSHEKIINISSVCDSWQSIQSCSPCR